VGIFLATAHPAKFAEIVDPIIGHPVEKPEPLARALARPRHIIRIDASLEAVRTILAGLRYKYIRLRMHRYRREILDALWRHGVQPKPSTEPEVVRHFVRDLYKYEIRRLRERYIQGEFPKQEYSSRVDALRRSYPVLAWPSRLWTE